ncbi:winged helix-turn-helix domain-containing protein [Galactobacter valiniphilus]|uniref:winged helix-turn-helix domain-containing protein n=1 Tax=Galactobacter valiniphilus TaxID=2676122 RepID=UPI003736ABD8
MSTNAGYVHISVRNAQTRAAAARRQAAWQQQAAGLGVTPMSPEVTARTQQAGPAAVLSQSRPGPERVGDTKARGFVLYVGLDEAAAAAAGTSLTKLATQVRGFLQTLAPEAQTHAAVALAAAGAPGADLEVVRQALGDPTVSRAPRTFQRQSQHAPAASGVLIDLSRREVQLDGEVVNLTYKEFELLNYLVENGTRTVGREELLENLWKGADEIPNERTIDVHIRRLRAKLGRLSNTVRTVRGQGYRFYEHPEVTVWAAPEYSI